MEANPGAPAGSKKEDAEVKGADVNNAPPASVTEPAKPAETVEDVPDPDEDDLDDLDGSPPARSNITDRGHDG